MIHSVAEENYLKAIYSLTYDSGVEYTGTNLIAEKLTVKAASITDMLQRLADKKLINYKKYKGVKLSSKGLKLAIQIVRKHRLWEVFLVDKLHFSWDEVHDIAEQLEHIKSDILVERLDKFLGFPSQDPHGDPIPDAGGKFHELKQKELSLCVAGDRVIFSGVKSHSPQFLQHLTSVGFKLGCKFEVIQVNAFDGLAEIKFEGSSKSCYLGQKTTSQILIQLI